MRNKIIKIVLAIAAGWWLGYLIALPIVELMG